MMTRRTLMTLLAGSGLAGFGSLRPGASSASAHGVSSRAVKPMPRGKPSGLPFHARFTDVARQAGLTHPSIYGGIDSKRYIVEVVGCGVAFLDYDNDGWLDVLVLSGTRLEGAPADATNRLYRNNRDGTFTDVTAKAGLTRIGWASSVTVGDFDNDGFDDLFITGYGYDALYRNDGDGTFTDVTAKAGLMPTATRYGAGCTWIDYDRDGRLDLLVARYLDTTLEKLPKPGDNPDCRWKGVPVNCGPRGMPTGYVQLFRNNGDGTFTDVSQASGVAAASKSYPMTTVVADYDNDGWPDVYVACDSTPSWLFRNQRDGTFREEALERGVALSEDGLEQAGMGVAIGDIDLDGSLDLFKTHFADDTNGLYRGDGKGYFDDVTIRAGIGVETRYVGWGAGMVDLDNDGLPDLFMVTGGVYPEVERTLPAYPFRTPRLVFRNLGNGRFEELIEEAGPGVAAVHASRGCAFGDFDNDGDVDVLIWNMNEAPSLLRNDVGGSGRWLKVLLAGTTSNRSAIGARVTAHYGGRAQTQHVTAQSSFYSVNDRRLHFGLGEAGAADLTIRWPSGTIEKVANVAAGQLVTIREGAGIQRKQTFR
jgi:enediyne biosynthesis protein E4